MRVEFSSEVLSDPKWYDYLDRIVYFFDEERHIWHSEDPDDVTNSDWFSAEDDSRSARRIRELFEKSVVQEEYQRAEGLRHSICIVVSGNTLDETGTMLAPNDAYRALNRPGYVVVEDAESDSAFVNAMVQAHGRDPIDEAIEKGWLQFEHMGGCGQLERTLKRIRSEPNGSPGPMRTVVVVDSDRLFPGQETENSRRVDRLCSEFGAVGWVLQKREAENYLPIPVLNNAGSLQILRAFGRLSQLQKDFFDMKHGFPNEGIPPEQNVLYQGVSNVDIERLKRGFGTDCWRLFHRHTNLFTADEINKICPDDSEEISRILDSLESLI